MRPIMLLGALACLGITTPANALGRLITPAASSARIEGARLAVTATRDRTTAWISVFLAGEAPTAAWVLPVPAGAVADRTSSRWLWALDEATSPRIFPPFEAVEESCVPPGLYQGTMESRSSEELAPSEAEVVSSLDDLKAYASRSSLALSAADMAALSRGAAWLTVRFTNPRGGLWTEPVRLVTPRPLGVLELTLLRTTVDVSLTLYLLSDQATIPTGLAELTKERLQFTWRVSTGGSDYLGARSAGLGAYRGGAAVREYVGSAALFDWVGLPEGAGVVAPAPVTYYELTTDEATPATDRDACATRFMDFQQQTARASLASPPGGLARVPLEDESDPGGNGQEASGFDATGLTCGTADDVTYALGGLTPDAVVTRYQLLIGPSTPGALEFRSQAAGEVSGAVRAPSVDPATCLGEISGAGGASAGTSLGQQGTPSTEPEDQTVAITDPPTPYPVLASEAGCSCGPTASTTSSSGDGCDSGSEEGTDGCDSDSGPESGGDGCDSENDSGYSGDTCGSSSGDGGCDSGGEGYSGDTCSSGGGGGTDCRLGPKRRRVRLSAWLFLGSALLLPLRRRSRPRAGCP